MKSRCYQRGCVWELEVTHMDEAVDQLRQHYRAVHPTKAFYEHREMESLEQYNRTADEFCEQYLYDEGGRFDWRAIAHEITRQRRWHDEGRGYLDPEVIVEVEARVAANPQEARQAQRDRPRFDILLNEAPLAAPEDGF